MDIKCYCIRYIILFSILQLFFSCPAEGVIDSMRPELTVKNENGKSMLYIGGKDIGNWFYMVKNYTNIKIKKYYDNRVFKDKVCPFVKILVDPEPLGDFSLGETRLEIVKNENEANGRDKIFLENQNDYMIFFFYPDGIRIYPVFYFTYEVNKMKLVVSAKSAYP